MEVEKIDIALFPSLEKAIDFELLAIKREDSKHFMMDTFSVWSHWKTENFGKIFPKHSENKVLSPLYKKLI